MLDYNNKLTPPADLIDALRNIPNKASIVASRGSTSLAPVQNDNRQQHLMKDAANPLQATSTDATISESEPILPISVSAPVAVIMPLKQGIMKAQCSSSRMDMATKATNHQDRESAATVTPQSQEEGEKSDNNSPATSRCHQEKRRKGN